MLVGLLNVNNADTDWQDSVLSFSLIQLIVPITLRYNELKSSNDMVLGIRSFKKIEEASPFI